MQKVARIRSWKRALAASEKEAAALRAEKAEFGKKARQVDVHKKAADDLHRRLGKLTRDYERQGQELLSLQLAHSETHSLKHQLVDQQKSVERMSATSEQRVHELTSEVTRLQQLVTQLQYERRKDAAVLRMAPRLPASESLVAKAGTPRRAKHAASGASLYSLLQQMQEELGTSGMRNQKLSVLLMKAMREADAVEQAQQDGAVREEELLELLVSHVALDPAAAGGGHADAPAATSAANPTRRTCGSSGPSSVAPPTPRRRSSYGYTPAF